MDSVYRWKGAVENERERQLIIKTTVGRLEGLKERLDEIHPAEVPEFIVIPVVGGSDQYLSWLRQSTT